MEIIIIAAIVTVALIAVFVFLDQKQKKAKEVEEGTGYSPDAYLQTETPVQAERNKNLIYYAEYDMPHHERILYIIIGAIIFAVVGYLFYMKIIVALLFACLGFFYPKIRTEQIIKKRQQELLNQFKQALYSLSSALSAGKSVENSFIDIVDDLRLLYSDPNTYIIREFEQINRRVQNGDNIEDALQDLADRAELEDITNFVNVFVTTKRTGGNLKDIIRRTSNILSDKLEIENEIKINIAQKKFEANVMLAAPLAIILMLVMSSPDYMAPLYSEIIGALVMTVALAIYAGAFYMVNRIMKIEV